MKFIRKFLSVLAVLIFAFGKLYAVQDIGQVQGVKIVSARTPERTNKTGARTTVATQSEVEALHPESTGSLLDSLGGVSALSYGSLGTQQSANIMGMGSSRTKVLLNRMNAVSAHDGTFDFSVLSPFIIERLEVVTSGAGEKGVSAIGGVINISTGTAKKDDPLFKIRIENGSYLPETGRTESLLDSQKLNVEFSKRLKNIGIIADIGVTRGSNNYTYIYEGTKYVREGAQMAGADGSVTIDGVIGETYVKSFNIFSFRNTGIPGSVDIPSDGNQRNILTSTVNNINYRNWDFDASYSYSPLWYNDTYSSDVHNRHKAELGASANYDLSDRISVNPYLTAESDFVSSTSLDRFRARILPQIGLTSSFSFGRFSLYPSLGAGFATDIKKFVPKASLGMEFRTSKILSFNANGTYAVNLPSFSDLYWPYTDYGQWYYKGNPNLKPETSVSGDIGLELGNSAVKYSGSGFVKYLWNAIISSADFTSKDNLSNSFWFGFNQNITASAGNFKASAGWLVNNSYDISSGKKIGDSIPVYGVRKHTFTLVSSYLFGSVSVSADAKFLSPRNLCSEKWLFLVNAGVDWKANDTCSVYLKADNVLNSRYEYVSGYPMPGLKIRIGGTWRVK